MIRFLTLLAAAAALAFAGCGGDDDSDDDAGAQTETSTAVEEATTETQPAQAAAGTTIKTADSQFGPVLFDGSDQAIYFFDKEKSANSECYDACAEAWPPVLTEGEPQAGGSVKAGLLGTTQRDDGTTQVTYNGRPLYFYAHEGKGEVTCHNVDEFGGLWLAVDPAGNPV
ncbi:MAG: COG4315 family predicted lipoprotein [Solirubrobacterales bacterium]